MTSKVKIVFWTILVLILINISPVFAKSYTNSEAFQEIFIQTGLYDKFTELSNWKSFLDELDSYKYIQIYTNSKTGWIDGTYSIVVRVFDLKELPTDNTISNSILKNGYRQSMPISMSSGYIALQLNNPSYNNIYRTFPEYYYYYTNVPLQNKEKDFIGEQGGTSGIEVLDLSPEKKEPYFEFDSNILDGKLTLENGTQLDFVPLEKLAQNKFVLGRIYVERWNDIGLVQLEKQNEDWTTDWNDYYIDLYRKDTIVGGKLTGYLNPVFDADDNLAYIEVEVPSYFIETNKFYNLSLYNNLLEFKDQSDNFYIGSRDENGNIIYSGTVSSGDNNISQGDQNKGLIDGLLNGLIGLFVPNAEFFQNYFDELNVWFSERLGLLYFPFELLFSFFDKVQLIDFSNPTLEIGPYNFPQFDNVEIVPKLTFDFNTYTENEIFKMIHDVYLVLVDGFIIFGLVGLIQKKYEEVMTQ